MLLIRFNSVKERLGEALHKETYVSPLRTDIAYPKNCCKKKQKKGGRKRASSRVLINNPVRDEIEANKANGQTKGKKIPIS